MLGVGKCNKKKEKYCRMRGPMTAAWNITILRRVVRTNSLKRCHLGKGLMEGRIYVAEKHPQTMMSQCQWPGQGSVGAIKEQLEGRAAGTKPAGGRAVVNESSGQLGPGRMVLDGRCEDFGFCSEGTGELLKRLYREE